MIRLTHVSGISFIAFQSLILKKYLELYLSRSVLLIDDNETVGRLFGVFLQRTDFSDVRLICVTNVEDGLQVLDDVVPAVILLDNFLGLHRSYHEPLRLIREKCSAPVILVSGSELNELGHETIPPGLSGYISKADLTSESIERLLRPYLVSDGSLTSG